MLVNKDNIDIVKLLIDNFKDQIDISIQDKYSKTALLYALSNDNIDIAKLLIDNFKDQIDISSENRYCDSALAVDKADLINLLINNFKDQIIINIKEGIKENDNNSFYSDYFKICY